MSSAPHHISKEAKRHKDGLYMLRTVKRGYGRSRRKFGEIHAYTRRLNGQLLTICWIFRRTDQLYVSDNTWAIETATLDALSPYAVNMIGLEVEDGQRLLIRKVDLTDPVRREAKGIVLRDFVGHKGAAPGAEGKTGMRQYHVPVAAFARYTPPQEESDAAKLALIRIKGRGTGMRAPVKPATAEKP
jgi:hypothetical protein